MTRDKIIEIIGDKEIKHNAMDVFIVSMFQKYEVNNIAVANRLLYSGMLSFGYLEEEEAIEILDELVGLSSFELYELVSSIVPFNIVEFYERMLEQEYLTSLNVVSSNILKGTEELEEAVQEAQKALEEIETKFQN